MVLIKRKIRTVQEQAALSRRFEQAKDLFDNYGYDWADAFKLASGQRVGVADDYYDAVARAEADKVDYYREGAYNN